MRFKFNVNINDEIYYRYNHFLAFRSYYGKIQEMRKRIAVGFGCFLGLALYTLFEGISAVATASALIAFIVIQLLVTPLSKAHLNRILKNLKRQGKLRYDATSEIEFLDNSFVETTEDFKTQQKYKLIDRVSILAGEAIYVHINNLMSVIIPIDAFESNHEYAEFVDFIKSKCDNVDVY